MAANPTRTQAGKPGSPSKPAGLSKRSPDKLSPDKPSPDKPGPDKSGPDKAGPDKAGGAGKSGGGKGSKNAKERAAAERRARAQEARAQAAKAERRSKSLRIGGLAAVAAVGVGIIAVAAFSGGHDSATQTPTGSAQLPHPAAAAGTATPPWAVPPDTVGLGEAAGLRALNAEGEVLHFHPHLDVLVDGKPVTVPADIGIDTTGGKISELHTHDTTGVLHVEAPDKDHRYVLGQLFAEWNVRLDATHLGSLTAGGGNTLIAYVDGKQVSGDPGQIELLPHREIALVLGPADQHVQVPSSYQFPAGE